MHSHKDSSTCNMLKKFKDASEAYADIMLRSAIASAYKVHCLQAEPISANFKETVFCGLP